MKEWKYHLPQNQTPTIPMLYPSVEREAFAVHCGSVRGRLWVNHDVRANRNMNLSQRHKGTEKVSKGSRAKTTRTAASTPFPIPAAGSPCKTE